jgi:hypothetical protein
MIKNTSRANIKFMLEWRICIRILLKKGYRLLAQGGMFSYIVANKWLRANYGKPLRDWLKTKCIEEITDFGDLPVFTSATTYPCIHTKDRR